MPKILVKNKDFEAALRNFKRVTSETRKDSKKHEFHLKKGLLLREKSKAAEKKRIIALKRKKPSW
ncbi:MAG: 30S ribosomal protein S21 [Mycoplasmoidaceae bacterium]